LVQYLVPVLVHLQDPSLALEQVTDRAELLVSASALAPMGRRKCLQSRRVNVAQRISTN